ncbi:hypothetical protein ACH5RR_016241 [Cinchona calisaya]|uniref:Dynamin-related protein 4C-like n=1 Tax=Cinchona calisaya TaxID=153742 RepID=A0ABD2ZVF3_9GENT
MGAGQNKRSAFKNKAVVGESEINSSVRVEIAHDEEPLPVSVHAPPIVSSYNDRIRPLLDCVDRLRNLKITQEGIQLPTIVVVGDQSSGKSSVLESLAGISLPRGQGICTRVPLIMRLQSLSDPQPELYLEYNGKLVSTDEDNVAEAISFATDEIAGRSKGISNTPLTLVVKKNGVPDLTMVDLPGITRVPVHGQPEDIYEQISAIIMEYIKPEESIILNVLSATVDFTTCESIRMSQRVDKTGERTLAVVTKSDRAPEGLLEKVTTDDVNIGLGYVCVRNRIGNESYQEARAEEAMLFETHHLLSKISKSMVGIPVLAQKLVQIQANIISKCLPDIVGKINNKLGANIADLNMMPQNLTTVAQAMSAFMRIMSSAKESSRKIYLRVEFDEYPDEKHMHCTARLAEMLSQFSDELQLKNVENESKNSFLKEEISILEEAKGIGLPNFLPHTAFLTSLLMKVHGISSTPVEFVGKIWNYVESVLVRVLMKHCDNYPQLQSSIRRAAQNLVVKKKEQSVDWVMEIIEMEKLTDYTCNPEYVATWNSLMAKQEQFMEIMNDHSKPTIIGIDGIGDIDVGYLRKHAAVIQQAFDLKMRMKAYWKLVLRRMVDCMALHVLFSIQNLVNKDMEAEILHEVLGPRGGGIERLLEECPLVAEKRYRLNRSITLLKESKEVVATIIDGVSAISI